MFLDLGPVMNFVLFDAGFYDLHYLNVRIPCYKLRACCGELSDDMQPQRITWDKVIQCMNMKLWDEAHGKMVGFLTSRSTPAMTPAE